MKLNEIIRIYTKLDGFNKYIQNIIDSNDMYII